MLALELRQACDAVDAMPFHGIGWITQKPFSAPVGKPMPALGQRLKSRLICCGSFSRPSQRRRYAWRTCRSLVPGGTGNTINLGWRS